MLQSFLGSTSFFIVAAASLTSTTVDRSECSARAGQPGSALGSSVLQLGSSRHELSQSNISEHARSRASKVDVIGNSAIPCSIHQTWKTSDISKLSLMQQESLESFKKLNPDCHHKFWSDEDVDQFIKEEYPELSKLWTRLEPIQRADLFRYAVILKHGGYYVDLDVTCLKPIKDWGVDNSTKLIVGYETGWHLSAKERKWVGFARSEQFEQWLFAAVPAHPVLRKTLDLFQEKFKWIIDDTIELTGPGLFSDAMHEYLFQLGSETAGADERPSERLDEDKHMPLHFPPGWKNNAHVFIFSADMVASPGFSTSGINSDMIIRHGFEGTWKEAESESQ